MLTPKIQAEATQLMSNAVPSSWEKQWEGPENPASWLRIVNRKGLALCKWVQRVQAKALLKEGVGLNDLFHPETFINAFRQRCARMQKVAIDELKLISNFSQASASEGTILLKGLWLQGSSFDGKQLTEVEGQASEILELPTCQVSWIPKNKPEPVPIEKCVEIPVYHTLDRATLLCTFNIPNSGDASRRIISGVALFLNGSE